MSTSEDAQSGNLSGKSDSNMMTPKQVKSNHVTIRGLVCCLRQPFEEEQLIMWIKATTVTSDWTCKYHCTPLFNYQSPNEVVPCRPAKTHGHFWQHQDTGPGELAMPALLPL